MERLFAGTLDELRSEHATFETGLRVEEITQSGGVAHLRFVATLLDTNEAQGRTTDFDVVVEARP